MWSEFTLNMRKESTINSEDETNVGVKGWWHQCHRCHGNAPEELEKRSGDGGAIRTRDQGVGFNRTTIWRPGRVSESNNN